MFKNIVVPLINGPGDATALQVAQVLAYAFAGHVTPLVTVPLPAARVQVGNDTGRTLCKPSRLYAPSQVGARRDGAARLRECRGPNARTQVLPASRVAALQARYADVGVVATEDAGAGAVFENLLFDSRRPVLGVTAGAWESRWLPRRIVVAWTPTAQAYRAVHDALPLLTRAQEVAW